MSTNHTQPAAAPECRNCHGAGSEVVECGGNEIQCAVCKGTGSAPIPVSLRGTLEMVRAHLVNIEDYDIEGPTISAIDAALAAPEAGSQS